VRAEPSAAGAVWFGGGAAAVVVPARREVGVLAPLASSAPPQAGGYRELLRLALPLIISNSFWSL
jgi:hypothetical protein